MGCVREKTNTDSGISETGKTHAGPRKQPQFHQAARTAELEPATDASQASANAEKRAFESGFSRTLYSGCHCTPTTNRAPSRLTASICPSGAIASTRNL